MHIIHIFRLHCDSYSPVLVPGGWTTYHYYTNVTWLLWHSKHDLKCNLYFVQLKQLTALWLSSYSLQIGWSYSLQIGWNNNIWHLTSFMHKELVKLVLNLPMALASSHGQVNHGLCNRAESIIRSCRNLFAWLCDGARVRGGLGSSAWWCEGARLGLGWRLVGVSEVPYIQTDFFGCEPQSVLQTLQVTAALQPLFHATPTTDLTGENARGFLWSDPGLYI